MNILYIHQYFKTPEEPGGTRSYWIAKQLISHGHKVTMLTTSPHNHKRLERRVVDGIDVIYLRLPYDQRMSIFRRVIAFLKFMLMSTSVAWKERHVDVVISTSTPLTVGFPALILKWFKKIPYIFEVRDLWPEVPIQMGALSNPVLQWIARSFEKIIYRNAVHVITLSPGMQDGVTKYISERKTSMIPNMAKIDKFWPRKKNWDYLKELDLSSNTFKVIHFGSLGVANGAEYIIDAAALLTNITDIEFLFVGGGSTESDLKQKTHDLNLTNVKFLGAFPMKQTSEIVNLCQVSIVSFRDIPILYTNSPNKLFDSLSAGLPILVNSRGWTKDLVENLQCGFFVDPQSPQDLADRVLFLYNNPELAKEIGSKSRFLAETKYDKKILSEQFVRVVESSIITKLK